VQVALLRPAAQAHCRKFANDDPGFEKLGVWLQETGIKANASLHACMEASGSYGEALARHLHVQGCSESLVNSQRIKAYGQSQLSRNKTDPADAALIADFCNSPFAGDHFLLSAFALLAVHFCYGQECT